MTLSRKNCYRTSNSLLAMAGLLALSLLLGCESHSQPAVPVVDASNDDAQFERQILRFCGDCHGMPRPSSFPKSSWEAEVEQGYQLFFESERTDLRPPIPKSRVLAYFTDRAEDEFHITPPEKTASQPPVAFAKRDYILAEDGGPVFASHVKFVEETDALGKGVFVCDMKAGRLLWASMESQGPAIELETFRHPAHVTVCDLDQDSVDDYLVADLGSFIPSDHSSGKLYWLRQNAEGEWQKTILIGNVGRVTSAETGDFDGDGTIDIVIAEFGWRETGSIHLLRGLTNAGDLRFQHSKIDNRVGAIDVQRCDLNGDGKLDFVTLLAQHHEAVVAFLNKGDAQFDARVLWEADYPSYGSSGFELADVDGDGDLDVIYTNGDSFDDFHIKPYHYVQWLENKGDFPFERHQITTMPGVHRAMPGDFDGDGDLDIVAVAMLPEKVENPQLIPKLDSVILLEQGEDQQFTRHPLETGFARHATLTVGDFDADDDLDFAVGIFRHENSSSTLSLWINQRSE